MLLGGKEDRDPGPKCPFLFYLCPLDGFQALRPCEVLSGQAPRVHMKTVTLTLGVARGPALRLQSCQLPMWASLASMRVEASWSVLPGSGLGPPSVGGCNPSGVGICELCGGSHGHVVDTPEGACAHLGWTAFCPAPLSVPRFLNLSLSLSSLVPRLPSCDGPAAGDVWTPSDIAVCFSRWCSSRALV